MRGFSPQIFYKIYVKNFYLQNNPQILPLHYSIISVIILSSTKEESFGMTVLAFIVLIGVLIWIHELGHFLMAKLFRVRVDIFSIGFGPRIVSKKIGETTYQIAAVPLGGFVKLYGEESNVDDPRAMSSKAWWQKVLIALGGPLFNIIFTVLLFAVVFTIGRDVPLYMKKPVLVGYVEEGGWADKVGIKTGDIIEGINGERIKNWEELYRAFIKNQGSEAILNIKRNNQDIRLKVRLPSIEKGREDLGIFPTLKPVIGRILPGSPASQVGIKEGDRIIEVNGKRVENWYEVTKLIKENGFNPLRIKLQRNGEIFEKTVVPQKDPARGRPMIGVSVKVETVKEKTPFPESVKLALNRTYELTVLTFKVLWGLITGDVSFKTLGGPIAIAQFAGQAAESGLIAFLSSMAFISLQLGIFNLIPLPVLDGGLIMLFIAEAIRGKPFSDKFKEVWQRLGFALIITLLTFVIINDLLKIFGG